MNRQIRFLALALITLFLIACHRGQGGNINVGGDLYSTQPEVSSPYKVKVVNVYNDTREVYDVDVIGLLWDGIDSSLKKRGMLPGQQTVGEPYVLEAHIVAFKKGSAADRWLPRVGDTVLVARAELSQGGRSLATIESKRKIAYGSKGTFTRNAWRKVFEEVSEDIVNQAVKKF